MCVQKRNFIKLSRLIQINSRTPLHISGIFMLSCIFCCNLGKFVTNNGFEEIIYQARMCSVGGIKPVRGQRSFVGQWFSGAQLKNCCRIAQLNMCWRINKVVAETVRRLFQEQYIVPLISEKFVEEKKIGRRNLEKF